MLPDPSPPSGTDAAPVPPPIRHDDALACSAPPLPQGPSPVCPRRAQEFGPWRLAASRQARRQRAVRREEPLHEGDDQLHARIRSLEQQPFGRKADPPASGDGPARPKRSPRPRGQQRGQPGPERRDYSHLPAVARVRELPPEQPRCSGCGPPFAPFPGTDEATVREVEGRPQRRISHRRRYRPTRGWGRHPGRVTAPAPGRVIPESIPGVSVWVTVSRDKSPFSRPTYRLREDRDTQGLGRSQGTLTDGLQRVLPSFGPLDDHPVERRQQPTLWPADEARWLASATQEGTIGHRWYLWAFHAADVAALVWAPGRWHEIPEGPLGPVEEGIVVVDRSAAYRARAQVKDGTILPAPCGAPSDAISSRWPGRGRIRRRGRRAGSGRSAA